nr:hypothetical protein [Tanacetum cinerariifolium]
MNTFTFFLFLIALILCSNCLCSGNLCIENERVALLQFKHDLVDDANRLSSWSSEYIECCSWAGIVCDNVTGHVHELHLQGHDPEQMLGGDVNPSLVSLKQLKYLDLSSNSFNEIQIPSFIGSLGNLRYLNLSMSQFQGGVPYELGNLSMLVVLDLRFDFWLSNNHVKDLHWLSNLQYLEYLDMSSYDLNSASDHWLQVINTLPSLVELHLTSCNLSQIPQHLSSTNLTSLTNLDLSFNIFNSSMPRWIFSLSRLVYLDLTRCLLHGPDPDRVSGFHNLTNLKVLHVAENDFMNSISVLRGLSSLTSLEVLDVNTCNISAPILSDLSKMTSLVSIDLSQNQILETLPNSFHNLCNLTFIDLRDMFYSGNVSDFLNNLCECKSPKISGTIPDSLGRLSSLEELRLNVNLLSDCWLNWPNLLVISFQNNNFSGEIPQSVTELPSLESFNIRNNNLSGDIPASLLNLKSLQILELSENDFSGRIPMLIGREETQLKLLSLRSNRLDGEIPVELCRLTSIQILDLAHNNLSGTLPTCFYNFSSMFERRELRPFVLYDVPFQVKVLGSASLVAKGKELKYTSILYLVTTLDLSSNKLYGSIPKEIMGLLGLRWMNLSGNHLTGKIPEEIGTMTLLESLDLSANEIDGKIPLSISRLSLLTSLNLSFNKLTGQIPTGTQLQTFNESSFMGNMLCGPPLSKLCKNKGISPDANTGGGKDQNDDESDVVNWGLVISVVLGYIISFWAMIVPLIASKEWRSKYFYFLYKMWFKVRNTICILMV